MLSGIASTQAFASRERMDLLMNWRVSMIVRSSCCHRSSFGNGKQGTQLASISDLHTAALGIPFQACQAMLGSARSNHASRSNLLADHAARLMRWPAGSLYAKVACFGLPDFAVSRNLSLWTGHFSQVALSLKSHCSVFYNANA